MYPPLYLFLFLENRSTQNQSVDVENISGQVRITQNRGDSNSVSVRSLPFWSHSHPYLFSRTLSRGRWWFMIVILAAHPYLIDIILLIFLILIHSQGLSHLVRWWFMFFLQLIFQKLDWQEATIFDRNSYRL